MFRLFPLPLGDSAVDVWQRNKFLGTVSGIRALCCGLYGFIGLFIALYTQVSWDLVDLSVYASVCQLLDSDNDKPEQPLSRP